MLEHFSSDSPELLGRWGDLNGASAPTLRPLCVEQTACGHLGFAMLLSDSSLRTSACPTSESALGVLERCPVPVLAVADDGVVVFASTVFEYLLGYACDAVTAISYESICSVLPTDETLFAITRLGLKAIGRPLQSGQATVFVKMRKSATYGGADSDAMAMLKELTARLSPGTGH